MSADFAENRVVVVGAGPAGLYIAKKLSRRTRVLVVEAGALENPLDAGDGFYTLKVTGLSYPETGSRLTALGGTTNHWGGNSHPIAPELFAGGDEPAWPIGFTEYADQLDAAREFLNLKPFDEGAPTVLDSGVFAGHESLVVRRFRVSDPTLRLGDDAHAAAYGEDPDIAVLMETRVMEITLAPEGDRVAGIILRHRSSGETATIRPSLVVLATGGIENARLLLWSGRAAPAGNPLRGGPNQLTGRHFTEKPFFAPVDLYIDSRVDLAAAVPRPDDSSALVWELTDAFRRAHGLPRFGVLPRGLRPADPSVETSDAIFANRAPGYVRIDPDFQFDQTPNEGSYVSLASDLDADGMAVAELHWAITADDVAAYRRSVLLLCGLLSQKGVARARLKPAFRAEDWGGLYLGYCNHHLGTTRMAATPDQGVVDPNCRVFGLANLFVAGSSIFPASGYVNPTLSLVALAGRLADHLETLL